jgi:hypothetical protein
MGYSNGGTGIGSNRYKLMFSVCTCMNAHIGMHTGTYAHTHIHIYINQAEVLHGIIRNSATSLKFIVSDAVKPVH